MFRTTLLGAAAVTAITMLPAAASAHRWHDRSVEFEQDSGYGYSSYGGGDYPSYGQADPYQDRAYYGNRGYYDRSYRHGYNRRDYAGYGRRCSGTTGLIVGGAAGALLGREIGRRGSGTTGAILGAALGALGGRAVDKNMCRNR